MNRGGIESFMMNYYRHFDHTKIQVDFVVHGHKKGYYDDEIKQYGGDIYYVPVKSDDFSGNITALKNIFSTKKYNIVHSHMDAMSYIPLKYAKQQNIPFRIAHSHCPDSLTKNIVKKILNQIARLLVRREATHFFSCSKTTGEWLFGKKRFTSKGQMIPNAIEVEKFIFNNEIRNKIRKELNIENKFVLGHVGHFQFQKNHHYLIEIFSNLVKVKNDSILILIGEGEMQEEIKANVYSLGLSEKVIFLGSRPDVNEFLNAMDVFLLPSKFEGFPLSLIEAQTNGLPVFTSDVISKEIAITDLVRFKPLNNANEWIEDILEAKRSEKDMYEQITQSGYNIKVEAEKLQDFYLNLLK